MSEPVDPEEVARKDFSQSFRGFDQHEVRAYLGQLAREITDWRDRVEQLQTRVTELEAVPPDDLDEAALEKALGQEATRVIHAAREAAADIRTRAEEEAATKLADAESMLARSTAEADEAAATIRAEVEEALAALRADTERRTSAIIAEATAERDRVLGEIEALRSARDRLTSAFDVTRRALDGAADEVGDASAAVERSIAALSAIVEPVAPPTEIDDRWDAEPLAVEPEPSLDVEPEPEPPQLEEKPVFDPSPMPEARRSSVLKLVREREEDARGTPVAPPAQDRYEGVRIIRPKAEPEPEPEPEPAPVAEAEADAAIEPEPTPEETAEDGAVDGLFERLHADRAAKVANAEAVLAAPDPEPGPVPAAEHISSGGSPEPDAALLAARDERVADDERALVRSLKRALADEQNEVLDGLRRLKGAPSVAALLPERATHDKRFEAVLGAAVAAAAQAGGAAAGGKGGTAAPVAAELARSLVGDLRARVERAVEEAGGDVETLAEAVSATYREWKTARAEPLGRDAITAGFAAGMYAASSGTLRWVVDPAEGGCPDCDDNVLAGATAKGSAYPTGQLHPPAHAGCRCIVVTVS